VSNTTLLATPDDPYALEDRLYTKAEVLEKMLHAAAVVETAWRSVPMAQRAARVSRRRHQGARS